ncbi:MAG: cadmium-translocating P-type ATPase [Oscillospiraceae bacterium]|nr:cadmium-translocating P-type ATPase [Oscillospiraceae bacterium]
MAQEFSKNKKPVKKTEPPSGDGKRAVKKGGKKKKKRALKINKDLLVILPGSALLIAAMAVTNTYGHLNMWLKLAIFLVPYLVCGAEVLLEAGEKLFRGELLDEDFLMSVASIGALCLGEYAEAVAVMLFFRIGEAFEERAEDKSRRSISRLMDIRPDYACVEQGNQIVKVDPKRIRVGTEIIVSPGEKIPLDGVITYGSTTVDTSSLTGESMPRRARAGDSVTSGCVNISGLIRVRVTSIFSESTVSKILKLVEDSAANKSEQEKFITSFARVYTPVVVGFALLLGVVPSLITGDWAEWIRRALIFLVISCPCALVISVPLTFFSGIGGASRVGILIKGSNYIESLSNANIVVLDKTGTVTQGSFSVTHTEPVGVSSDTLLFFAACAECYSNHPIALSLRRACKERIEPGCVSDVREIPGRGISATVYDRKLLVGNEKLMRTNNIRCLNPEVNATVVHVAADGDYMGYIVIDDRIKKGAKESVKALHGLGVEKTVMLTGDNGATGRAVAYALGVNDVMTELLPQDKVTAVKELMRENSGGKLVFVGDGVNDAPVIVNADVGIAMGVMGSDAAIEAAHVVLMDDDIRKLPLSITIAKRTMRIARQNVWFSLAVKLIVLILGAFGIANMWMAVFADVGVLILALLNAARAMIIPEYDG